MSRFVLDCSVTAAWCFEDECDEYAEAMLDRLVKGEGLAPALWPLEMANVLLVAERRARLTRAQAERLAELLRELPIAIDAGTAERAMGGTLALARDQRLSAYDAAYLELAMREGVPLATRDRSLRAAAKRCGVPLAG